MKNIHGGKRQGAGPKFKYGEPTRNRTFRLPESKVSEIVELVTNKLKDYEISNKNS